MQPTSQTSRADLLRWMRRCHTPADKQLAAEILGYEWLEPQADVNLKIAIGSGGKGDSKPDSQDDEALNPQPEKDEEPVAITRPPEAFYALKHREQYAAPDNPDDDLPDCLRGVEPLSAADLRPLEPGEPLEHQPLVPQQRLVPFLRQALTYPLGRRLDVPRLVKQVARLQTLQRIPLCSKVLPAGRVYVLLDLNKRLLPFWQDAHDLCALLVRQHGKNGLDIRVLEDQPGGRYYDWFDQQQAVKPWQSLQSPSIVLIVSDLGQLSAQGGVVCQGWLRFAQQLARQGIRPLVLSPVSPAQQYAPFTAVLDQLPWGKLSRFQPQKPNQQQQEHANHVQRVLGLLSVAVHVEPELLRAILGCLPAIQADSGVEAAVYLHPDVVWGYTAMTLRAEKRAAYQALFRQEPVSLQREVLGLIRQQHIGQFPAVWAETVLNAQPLTAFALEDAAWAEQFMVRLTRSFAEQRGHEGMAQFARRSLQRLGSDETGKAFYRGSYANALYGFAYHEQLRNGGEVSAKYDADAVLAVVRQRVEKRRYRLLQCGEYLELFAAGQERDGWAAEVVLAEFEAVYDTLLVKCTLTPQPPPPEVEGEQDEESTVVSVLSPSTSGRGVGVRVLHLQGQTINLDTGLEKLVITPLTKPAWADSFGRDQYGLYADLNIKGITQRFRWINPGTFLMGSPESEPERIAKHEVQHPVTLTQGFWLADTTVTQALWQVVMGNNPSRFKNDSNNPVEQVNWNDSQGFLKRLNALITGLPAKLPTEAQWEYACRAGTTSPFSFGNNITPKKVNYNGNYPYADGKKGLNRQKTVPVKSLPANPWGLYEMHGNVWEWCQDGWQPEMSAEPTVDPEGLDAGTARVLRGGSWFDNGGHCRSADRYRHDPADRINGIGFRLSLGLELRSSQGGGAATQARAHGGDADRRGAGDTTGRGSAGSGQIKKET